ncbi:LysR family transcriptional regulator [Mesorhizobium amorphae]|nr:LysR family transcriptional regulator [Mesorhizobium amorphae]
MSNVFLPASDQVLIFLAVVDHGSFSAASRHLSRVQSAVTYAIQQLEADLGVALFDRSGFRPVLTDEGRALVPNARRIAHELRTIQQRARSLIAGEEPEVRLVVDAMFPMQRLLAAIKDFTRAFPSVTLRIVGEALGGSADRVLDRTCIVGIAGPIVLGLADLSSTLIGTIERLPVAAPQHPLAQWQGEIPPHVLGDHVQLVTTDRSSLTEGQNFGVLSPMTWRLTDLGAKHAMILAGLGWGSLPRHMIENDLRDGRLTELRPAGPGGLHWASVLPIYAVHRSDAELGPAARHLLEGLKTAMSENSTVIV